MTVTVTCPNPRCKHHKVPFSSDVQSPIAAKGGAARWKNMSAKEKAEHIARMGRARLKNLKKKK